MADLVLTSPNASSFVRAGEQLPIAWTYSGSYPPTISIELVDNSKQLFTGPLALFSNLPTTSGSASWPIPKLGYVSDNVSIILIANIAGTAVILAEGPKFSIKPENAVRPPAEATASSGSSSFINNNSSGNNDYYYWSLSAKAILTSLVIAACTHL
ncbi:hypothetical protein BG004_006314 [Podila humilis]|nr:hypothetical protein BG004_006314 [Podila humilis]